jgi:hypothetical protein
VKTLYPSYAESLLDSSAPNLSSTNIKIAAFTTANYTYSAAHTHADDLGTATATTGNLASKTIDDGTFDAANPSLGSPAGGATITRLVMYQDSGTPATSPLIAYTDEDASGAALSIATNGEAITVSRDVAEAFFALGGG